MTLTEEISPRTHHTTQPQGASEAPNGGLVMTQKFLDGTAEYARTWPGPVTSLVELEAEGRLGHGPD